MPFRQNGWEKLVFLSILTVLSEKGITPHFFEPVKRAAVGMHDMYYYIHVIEKYPLQLLLPLLPIRTFRTNLFDLVYDIVCNSPYLGGITGLTNNKEIGYCLIDLSEIERNNPLSFFLTNGSDNGLDDLRAFCKTLYRLFTGGRSFVLAPGQ